MNFTNGETVTRLRAPLIADTYSGTNTKRNWAAAASLSIAGCAVAPSDSTEEQTVARGDVTTTPMLYAPYGSDVLVGDRIVSTTGTWDVHGHGSHWHNPFTGWEPGSTWPLRRVDG